MRKPSKNVARAEYETARKAQSLAELGLYVQTTERPDHVDRFRVDDWRYDVRLYRAKGCHGGITITVGRSLTLPNNHKTVDVQYLDDVTRYWRDRMADGLTMYHGARDCYDRLAVLRDRMFV